MTSQKTQAPLLEYIAGPVLPDDVMKECIPLNDGIVYFDDSTNPHELQVRCNGQIYDAQLPVQVSRGCFADGNTILFSGKEEGEPRKYYTALFTPGQGIRVSHLRDELKDETLCKLGLVHRKTGSGDVLYRIYDDPSKGIAIDTNSAVKKKLKFRVIHRGKIICVRPTSAEKDLEVSVRKIVKSENILDMAIKVPDSSLYEWNSFAYAHDSSRFCYISDGKMLFVLDTDALTVLTPLRFSDEIEVSSITGVLDGIMTVNGIDLALRYYSRTAKLPEGYFGNASAKGAEQSTAQGSDHEEFESLFLRNFKPTVLLGTGGFGCVFKVTSLREYELDSEYAVKRIPIQGSKDEMDKILEEACALSGLEHPGIVDYIRSWTEKPPKHWQRSSDNELMKRLGSEDQCDYGDDASFLYIQTELCGSTLYRRLVYERLHNITPILKKMKSWFKQLLEAVAYLHDNNKIHRDLKPSNILITGEDNLKICDLGFVAERFISNGQELDRTRSAKGTMLYMAPEQAIPNLFTNKLKYGSMVDVFALGLIFAELCVRFADDDTRDEVFESYRKRRPLDDRPIMQHLPEVDALICKLTNRDPKQRPSCQEILQLPIILELDYVRLA